MFLKLNEKVMIAPDGVEITNWAQEHVAPGFVSWIKQGSKIWMAYVEEDVTHVWQSDYSGQHGRTA